MYTSIEMTLGYGKKSSGRSYPKDLAAALAVMGENRTPYALPARTVGAWTQAEAIVQLRHPGLCTAASVTVCLEAPQCIQRTGPATPTIDAITRDTGDAPID
jgi:hypothetical protein